jgi:hypothetical protein
MTLISGMSLLVFDCSFVSSLACKPAMPACAAEVTVTVHAGLLGLASGTHSALQASAVASRILSAHVCPCVRKLQLTVEVELLILIGCFASRQECLCCLTVQRTRMARAIAS